ncbi:MAG: DUF86 domain-containing protein [bacterium]|nr:DUF86 domain-containing protein [bacterium]
MKNPKVVVLHILDAIYAIEEYVKGYDKSRFEKDAKTQDAVIRRLEIIGEACTKLSDNFQQEIKEIPWSKIKAMRNVLIHEYWSVDLDLVWDVVKNKLPELKKYLKAFNQN